VLIQRVFETKVILSPVCHFLTKTCSAVPLLGKYHLARRSHKGTVQRDFLIFIKQLILALIDMPEISLESYRISIELFLFEMLKNLLPAINDSSESKKSLSNPFKMFLEIFLKRLPAVTSDSSL
jgi:hypothetical protein